MKESILIVDDMEINRAILAEFFKDQYDILEASDGKQAIDIINQNKSIAAVLLDLIMPVMGGLEVLKELNRNGKIYHIPVLVITASDSEKQLMDAYELGAVDVITKPFRTKFIKARINNIIELYRHRNDLANIVSEQAERINGMNQSIVETLASLIEFRDMETGEHVRSICGLTEVIMTSVSDMFPEYYLKKSAIEKIKTASVLHDVGKIAISDIILNKPGRLTAEEFEIIKQHTVKGCEILSKMSNFMDDDIYYYSYDICRHHHERWDGKGYPDGLKGDEISIWSQVVAIADVYDALTSKRVYKDAYDSDTAVKMINQGECGAFNPKVLSVFNACITKIKEVHQNINNN